jgi:hypothetical protein
MTTTSTTTPIPSVSGEASVSVSRRDVRSAEAFFVAGLAKIVGDVTITAGDDEFDYFVSVPVSRLHDVSQQISRLQLEVQERFGIGLSAMPIPFES